MQTEDQPIFVVFGGSFNPIHEGHVALVRGLATLPRVQQVLVVPARLSPFKTHVTPLPESLRLHMVQVALAGIPRVAVLDLELRRPAPSYTHQTLLELRTLYPHAHLQLALGWDAFREFAGWKNALDIMHLADLLVVARAGTAALPPGDLSAWCALLPVALQTGWTLATPSHLRHPTGCVLQGHDFDLPPLAASELLINRSLIGVPTAAQPMLSAYWAKTDGNL